jgi:CheY-like chemotaxis protein
VPKLLIVDDNAAGRETLAEVFRALGYEAAVAADGPAGLAAARSEKPDLILMDLSLPGLDGWEATRRLRADPATAHIPVVAMTAHVTPGDRERALAAGCDDHHPKPADFPRLLAQIERLLTATTAGQ